MKYIVKYKVVTTETKEIDSALDIDDLWEKLSEEYESFHPYVLDDSLEIYDSNGKLLAEF